MQFLSVLKDYAMVPNGVRPIFVQKVGGKGLRQVESLEKRNGSVILVGHECGKGDPPNFPSVPFTFRLSGRADSNVA